MREICQKVGLKYLGTGSHCGSPNMLWVESLVTQSSFSVPAYVSTSLELRHYHMEHLRNWVKTELSNQESAGGGDD